MPDKTKQLGYGFNAVGLGFILIELETAITFCDVALGPRDPAHAQLDVLNAKRALAAAARAQDRVRLTVADKQHIAQKTAQVHALLKSLDKRRQPSTEL